MIWRDRRRGRRATQLLMEPAHYLADYDLVGPVEPLLGPPSGRTCWPTAARPCFSPAASV